MRGDGVNLPAAIEADTVVPDLVKDLLHLKRRRDGLQQNRRPNRAHRNSHVALRRDEDVVPQPRLQIPLQLGQVEVRAAALLEEVMDVVEEVQAEVEQTPTHDDIVNRNMRLVQVPSSRPHEKRRQLPISAGRVDLAVASVGEGDRAVDCVAEVALALGEHGPRWRGRVFEVGHVCVGWGVLVGVSA